MSRQIDDRILKMQFDNGNFESNVKQSLGTLDKLKNALNFKGAANSLQQVEQMSNISFDGMANSISSISDRFSTLGIMGMRIIENFTDRIVNMGIQTAKSMTSIDQIASGWRKYEDMVVSQQTILSAVEGKINDLTGDVYKMDDVSEILKQLSWYSDETSYDMNQMVSAVGDFTSSGVDLMKAKQMIMGIANASADAGVGVDKAASAFIGFSKAIGSGELTLGVWNNQLKTSGITNSEKFKRSLLEAAVAEKTLTKINDDLYVSLKGSEITIANMTEYLNEGIINSKAMERVFAKYADTSDALFSMVNSGVIDTSSEALKDLTAEMEKQGKTLSDLKLDQQYDQAADAIQALTKAYEDLGMEVPQSLKAMTRAQEAVSLSQAIDSVRGAVAQKWNQTFELIFGNYEEAKKMWTDFSGVLYDIFAASSDTRNEILEGWKELGGRNELIDSIKIMYDAVSSLFEGIKKEFHKFFPELDVEEASNKLFNFTKSLKDYANRIKDLISPTKIISEDIVTMSGKATKHIEAEVANDGPIQKVLGIFNNMFNVFSLFKESVIEIGTSLNPLIDIFKRFGGFLLDVVFIFTDFLSKMANFIRDNKLVSKILNNISKMASRVYDKISSIFTKLFGDEEHILANIQKFFDWIYTKFTEFTDFISNLNIPQSFTKFVDNFGGAIEDLLDSFKGDDSTFFDKIVKLGDFLGTTVVTVFDTALDILGKLFPQLTEIFRNLQSSLSGLNSSEDLQAVLRTITGFLFDLIVLYKLYNMGTPGELIQSIADAIWGFYYKARGEYWKSLATAIGILVGSLFLLTLVDQSKLVGAVAAIYAVARILQLVADMPMLSSMQGGMATFGLLAFGQVIKSFAFSILLASASLLMLSKIHIADLVPSVIALILIIQQLKAVANDMGFFGAIGQNGKVKGLIAFSASLLIMVYAIKKLVDVVKNSTLEQFLWGIAAISFMILILDGVAKTMGGFKGDGKVKGLISFAGSLLIIVYAMKVLTESITDPTLMVAGVIALSVMLWQLVGVVAILDTMKFDGGGKFLAISVGLLLMVKAIKTLSDNIGNGESVMASFVVISMMLAMMAVIANITKGTVAGAFSILVMSNAMIILTGVLLALAKIPITGLVFALIVLATAIGILAVAGIALQESGGAYALLAFGVAVTALGIGLLLTSAAIFVFASALTFIGAHADIIVNGIIAILDGLITAVLLLAPKLDLALYSIAVLVVKTLIRTIPLIIDGIETFFYQILQRLGDMFGNLTVIVIELLVNALYDLSIAIMHNADGIITAIEAVLDAIGILIMAALKNMLLSLIGWIPGAKDAVNSAFDDFVDNVESSFEDDRLAYKAINKADDIIDGYTQELDARTPEAKEATNDFLGGLGISNLFTMGQEGANTYVSGFTSTLPDGSELTPIDLSNGDTGFYSNGQADASQYIAGYTQTLSDGSILTPVNFVPSNGETTNSAFEQGVIDGSSYNYGWSSSVDFGNYENYDLSALDLSGEMSELSTINANAYMSSFDNIINGEDNKGTQVSQSVLDGIKSLMPEFNTAGEETVTEYTNGIEYSTNTAQAGGETISNRTIDGIDDVLPQFEIKGEQSVDGYVSGLLNSNSLLKVSSAGSTLAQTALNSTGYTLDINSPSKKFQKLGSYSGEGFTNGILLWIVKASRAAKQMGEKSLNGIRDSVSNISSIFTSGINDDPIIKPLLDLSDIEDGMSNLDSMFANNRSLALAAYDSYSNVATPNTEELLLTTVDTRFNQLLDKLNNDNRQYTFETHVDLNGREIARGTANYMNSELNRIEKFNNRRDGIK